MSLILGIDWGEKRIGIAIGDSENKVASPFKTVGNLNELVTLIKEENAEKVIIGKPIKMDGSFSMKAYDKFLAGLKAKIKLEVVEIDERLSSKAADALPGSRKEKSSRDAMAAMIILQNYFDRP